MTKNRQLGDGVSDKLVISNMLTIFLPPNTFSRGRIGVDIALICGVLEVMLLDVDHNPFTTSERGIGPLPTTAANSRADSHRLMNADVFFSMLDRLFFNNIEVLIVFKPYF